MTLAAGIPLGRERGPAMDCLSFMGIVAITATDFPFDDRMMGRQMKLAAFIKMTLETSLRILSRIDDGIAGAAAFRMKAPRPVARFTTHLRRVWTFGPQVRMRSCAEAARDIFVALRAILRTNQLGARNLGRHDNSPIQCGARDNNRDQQCGRKTQRDLLCVGSPLHNIIFTDPPSATACCPPASPLKANRVVGFQI